MESLSTQVATNAQSIDVSLVISVISLTISFLVFAKDLWHERLRIDATLIKWFASHANDQPFFLWLVIQNNSSLPFSISKIELKGRSGLLRKKLAQRVHHIKIFDHISKVYTLIHQKLIELLRRSRSQALGAVYRVDVYAPTPLYAVSQGNKRLVAKSVNKGLENNIYSKEYPIVVNAYEGVGGYFHFTSDIGHFAFEDKTVSLIIHTNRGKRKIKNIRLKFGDNIMRAYERKEGTNPITHDAKGNLIEYTKETI